MYLKRLHLENIGPISECSFELPFHENGNPKPVIIVGENGTGKSILLSFIVNSIIIGKQLIFDNTEVEHGKTYKYRSPSYIKSGKTYYYSKVMFDNELQCIEWQLLNTKKEVENQLQYVPNNQDWDKIPEEESSLFWTNFDAKRNDLRELLNKNCLLYFPANRFEEPAWLNLLNLKARAEYSELKSIQNFSNRSIVHYAPLKFNQNWILDLLLDRSIFEQTITRRVASINGQNVLLNHFEGYQGNCSRIYESILQLMKIVMQTEDNLRFGITNRLSRMISIVRNEQPWIPNIFQLSTGQTLVLNLFLTIMRDYDLSEANFESLSEVRGLVIIDEIELHLHSNFQYQVLPSLIKLLPKVQFIITSHSPLFVLGLERELTNKGFSLREMPDGEEISAERFKEFGEAYGYFRETKFYEEDIRKALEEAQKPILFVEGDYDIRYLIKAAKVLNKHDLLTNFSLKDGDGFGNLDKIWNPLKQSPKLAEVVPQKIVLLYDCDTQKQDAEKGNVFKKVIPTQTGTPIKIGIENLFPLETIEKAEAYKRAFIDYTPEIKKINRGQEVVVPEKKEVNKDEKGNLCNWLCEVGTREDFVNFECIFTYLEQVIKDSSS
ncbi:MAG: AAA family ATPase [Aphanothece sp. CMT-3BRIN-NPC111]|jgi:predicted ATP-binding protein involved in virulence|nr:AAA family ATPase [Aphanothece sp. CMT-3BRIN-NPC111]